MSHVIIRGYRGEDEGELLSVWNAALPFDTVDAAIFRRKVLLDPNFHADLLLVAESDHRIVGFCLCLIRRVPLEGTGLEPERGWITAMGVAPGADRRGVGAALLSTACELFVEAERTSVAIAPYAPNYFSPGVDVERYAWGLRFLQESGFETVSEAISMDANIVLLDTPCVQERAHGLRQRGIEVRNLLPGDIPALLRLLTESMPGDWLRHARELLTHSTYGLASLEQFSVAMLAGEAVGYCQFEGEHFGPFGVREDMQGRGVGTVLLGHCLQTMRRHGHHNAWVLWTGDETAEKVYNRFVFKVTRRFAVLRRAL